MKPKCVVAVIAALLTLTPTHAAEPPQVSGIYPHLAMFNDEGECGTGAVVPWAGRLWAITYAPHMPKGSSDKLYEITPDLQQIIRPESIGGTPANRMIHLESQQLFIGPYATNINGTVRVISYDKMFAPPQRSRPRQFGRLWPAFRLGDWSADRPLNDLVMEQNRWYLPPLTGQPKA